MCISKAKAQNIIKGPLCLRMAFIFISQKLFLGHFYSFQKDTHWPIS
jgi:hypothetical protein